MPMDSYQQQTLVSEITHGCLNLVAGICVRASAELITVLHWQNILNMILGVHKHVEHYRDKDIREASARWPLGRSAVIQQGPTRRVAVSGHHATVTKQLAAQPAQKVDGRAARGWLCRSVSSSA